MNAMVHDMTWDSIQSVEGMSLEGLSDEEIAEVMGAIDWYKVADLTIKAVAVSVAAAKVASDSGWLN